MGCVLDEVRNSLGDGFLFVVDWLAVVIVSCGLLPIVVVVVLVIYCYRVFVVVTWDISSHNLRILVAAICWFWRMD